MHFKSSRGYDVLHALSAISLARPGKVQTSHYFSARATASTAIATLFIAPPTGLNRLKKGARRPEGERESCSSSVDVEFKQTHFLSAMHIDIYICMYKIFANEHGVESGRLWEHHFLYFLIGE